MDDMNWPTSEPATLGYEVGVVPKPEISTKDLVLKRSQLELIFTKNPKTFHQELLKLFMMFWKSTFLNQFCGNQGGGWAMNYWHEHDKQKTMMKNQPLRKPPPP